MSILEQAALELARDGYHVHPLRAGAKVPASGAGFKDATRDRLRIEQWWRREPAGNIGVACGASRLVVLDIDTKAGADPREILAELDRAGAPVVGTGLAPACDARHPDSLEGRRGAQVYFRGDLASTSRLTIPGVEIKGAGGYVVAPPSVHPSGVAYVGQLPPAAELPPVPDWLRALIRPVEPPRQANPLWTPRTAPAAGDACLDGILRTVREAPAGNRNHLLYWGACKVREHLETGRADSGIVEQLHGAAAATGLPDWEIVRTLRSALAGTPA